MGISLKKGESASLDPGLTKVMMGLGWDAVKKRGFFGGMKDQAIDLDASAVLYDAHHAVTRKYHGQGHRLFRPQGQRSRCGRQALCGSHGPELPPRQGHAGDAG